MAAAGRRVVVREGLVAGDVEEVAADLGAEVRRMERGQAIVAVGEPTVKVRGRSGIGGRAQHLALSMVAALASTSVRMVAVGSDGRDGPTEAAGAVVDGGTLGKCAAKGVDVAGALARFDSGTALGKVGALLERFDSGTNLTDLYILTCG
jgi:hydroxypyruvate reductase